MFSNISTAYSYQQSASTSPMLTKRDSIIESISQTPRELVTSSKELSNNNVRKFNSPLKAKTPTLNLDFLKAKKLNESHNRLINKQKIDNKLKEMSGLTERFDRFDYSQNKHLTLSDLKSGKNLKHKINTLSTSQTNISFDNFKNKKKQIPLLQTNLNDKNLKNKRSQSLVDSLLFQSKKSVMNTNIDNMNTIIHGVPSSNYNAEINPRVRKSYGKRVKVTSCEDFRGLLKMNSNKKSNITQFLGKSGNGTFNPLLTIDEQSMPRKHLNSLNIKSNKNDLIINDDTQTPLKNQSLSNLFDQSTGKKIDKFVEGYQLNSTFNEYVEDSMQPIVSDSYIKVNKKKLGFESVAGNSSNSKIEKFIYDQDRPLKSVKVMKQINEMKQNVILTTGKKVYFK